MLNRYVFPALWLALSAASCTAPPVAPSAPRMTPAALPATTTATTETARPTLPESVAPADFREAAEVRDPFRAFPRTVVAPQVAAEDDQLLGDVALNDLRLLAVVDSTQGPLAMVSDPSGYGTSLRRGMFVGRREVVRADDVEFAVRWRVARITASHLRRGPDGRLAEAPAEVVFERADPTGRALPAERALSIAPSDPVRMRGTFRLASAQD